MKPIIFLLTLLISCQVTKAQNGAEATFNAYLKAKESKNVTEQVEFLHPRLFEGYSKDTLIKTLEAFEMEGLIRVGNEKLVSSSEIITENGIKYALMAFSQTTTMDMSGHKNKGGADYAISLSLEELRNQHGPENVSFDKEKYIIKILTTSEMYAVLDPEYGSWKFLNKSNPESDIAKSIVPETVRIQLE